MDQRNIASPRETVYFVIALIFSILIYILAAVSIVGIVVAAIIFIIMMFLNLTMLGSIRGNGVRINEKQFPDVYERVVAMSNQMGLKKVPDVFVIQSEGMLNAFATRFWGRNMVVLYSEIFDLGREQGKEELDFIIAHELSHVKRRHVWKNILIAPAQFIPFLAQAYSRSCEYTCDREAAFIINNVEAAKRALTILSVGKQVYREVNEDAFVEQIHTESHGAVWMSEVLSTHPNLPKRIQSVSMYIGENERPIYSENAGKVIIGVLILGATVSVAYVVLVVALVFGSVSMGGLFSSFDEFIALEDASLAYDEDYEMTELMAAIANYDVDEVAALVEQGVDLEEQDSYGDTALTYAVNAYDPESLELLLEAGADPNVENSYPSTPLIFAVSSEFYDGAIMLLDYGADPSYEDIDGDSALSLMGVTTEEELYEALSLD